MKVPNRVIDAIRSVAYAHTKEARVYKRSENSFLVELAQGSAITRVVINRDGSLGSQLVGGLKDFSGHTEGTLIAKLEPSQWKE